MKKELLKFASSVGLATLISRILGYIRDGVVAYAFGANFLADSFYAAFRISNLFRRLLGEGALSASFVPVFGQYLVKNSEQETKKFFQTIFTTLLIVLIVICALGVIFAPQLTKLITWGFTTFPGKLELTVQLTRIMFPFLLFISMAALLMGVLNSLKVFFIPAISPAFLSISEIGCVFIVLPFIHSEQRILALAVSVVVGGMGQFIIQLIALIKKGIKPVWKFSLSHPGQKQVMLLMLPAMIGLSVDQINTFVDTICASFLQQGSITALYYSNRIMQLPLAIFGISLASVCLPNMSKSVAKNDIPQLKETLNYSLRIMILAILPATVGLIVLNKPIIQLLFERGRFDSFATLITASSLMFYSLGLIAYSGVKIIANCFYAFQDTKTPLKIGYVAMIVNITLNIILMRPLGVGGLALATAISSWINIILLAYFLRKKIGFLGLKSIFGAVGKIFIASIIMGVAAYYLAFFVFVSYIFLQVLASIACAAVIYVLMLKVFKLKELTDILQMARKETIAGNE
ncbi:MAG: murein biosynthesis integral membrane protein MurJ [bacterium]